MPTINDWEGYVCPTTKDRTQQHTVKISAHLLSRLAAVQDVLKTNSGGTKLLHALQSAGAELSSIGPALFDQFVSRKQYLGTFV